MAATIARQRERAAADVERRRRPRRAAGTRRSGRRSGACRRTPAGAGRSGRPARPRARRAAACAWTAGTDRRSPRRARTRCAASTGAGARPRASLAAAPVHLASGSGVRRRRELRGVDELELAPRALVEALRMQAQDLRRALADAELDAVARPCSSPPRWPSALQQQRRRALEHVHAQRLVRVQEDRAVERGVRRHRRDQQPAVARRDDRPAGGERVARSSRSAWRSRAHRPCSARTPRPRPRPPARRARGRGRASAPESLNARELRPGRTSPVTVIVGALLEPVLAAVDRVEAAGSSSRLTSARNASRPRLTPSTGTRARCASLSARRIVPSPPSPITSARVAAELLLGHGAHRRRQQVARLLQPAHLLAVPGRPAHDAARPDRALSRRGWTTTPIVAGFTGRRGGRCPARTRAGRRRRTRRPRASSSGPTRPARVEHGLAGGDLQRPALVLDVQRRRRARACTRRSPGAGRAPPSRPASACARRSARSSPVLTRPAYSSISFGLVPAASTRDGDSISSGMCRRV